MDSANKSILSMQKQTLLPLMTGLETLQCVLSKAFHPTAQLTCAIVCGAQ